MSMWILECGHLPDGWCTACVKDLQDKRDAAQEECERLRTLLEAAGLSTESDAPPAECAECARLLVVLEAHRRFHHKVACGGDSCYVCQAEDDYEQSRHRSPAPDADESNGT